MEDVSLLKKEPKVRLLDLRQKSNLTSQQIAQAAGVSLGETYCVEVGGFASQHIAHKVVEAFTRLSGIPLTVHDIVLNMTHETRPAKENYNN